MFSYKKPLNEAAILPWEENFSLQADTEKLPTMSIVIPIYNAGEFLEKTLRSLMCNDLNGVEIILMDGGSNDRTMEIVDYYRELFSVVESKKDAGQSDAINKGFRVASGEILYWLNGDDLILPNTLNHVRKYFLENQDCKALVGNAYMTEKDLSPIRHFVFSEEKLSFTSLIDYAKNHLIQPSVFFKREVWEKLGPLNINDHYAMDADLFIGISKDYKFHWLNIDIAYSVYHELCKTRGSRAESITALALVQAKHGGLDEAKRTLDILVDLYNHKEADSDGSDARSAVLEAKLETLESFRKQQAEICLRADMESLI